MSYSSFFNDYTSSDRVQSILKDQHDRHGDGMGAYKRNCHVCDTVFYAQYPSAKYCCYRCRNDAYIERRKLRRQETRNKVCGNCDVQFIAKRKDAKYCSSACRQSAYRGRVVTDKG